jgi:hypothetical protein
MPAGWLTPWRPAVIIRNPQLAVRANSSGTSMFIAALKDRRYATVLSVLRSAMVCLKNVFCFDECCLRQYTSVCAHALLLAPLCCCGIRVH